MTLARRLHTFQNNEFEIVDAVMGEGMDLTLAKQCIENALINADTEVDLEKAGVYDGTLVTADDETLNAQKDQLNELVRSKYHIQYAGWNNTGS